ncbi:MAG: hypothetical protein AB7S78_02845 [Candidatus Omnitrophota bacterium]
MNKQMEMILKVSTTFLLLILASVSICFVLDIFTGETAKEFAFKTIKVVGIIVVTCILLIFISNTGNKTDS